MSDILIVAEYRSGELRDVSYELVTAGNELTDGLDASIHVAVIGAEEEVSTEMLRDGVDHVHTVEYAGEFNHDAYVDIIEQLWDDIEPGVLVLPHTVTGMDYGPAVAGRLELPILTNAIDVGYDGGIRVKRKMYGGKVEATLGAEGEGVVLTVREGQFDSAAHTGSGEITRVTPDLDGSDYGTELLDLTEVAADEDIDISQADFIISIGLGIGDEENMEVIEELIETTDATLASSKPIVERGWLSRSRQVGQSGETVKPRVYVALGISGAIEHRVGMKGSDTIVAVNNDPDAPIFDLADYGVVDDLKDVVPELVDQIEASA